MINWEIIQEELPFLLGGVKITLLVTLVSVILGVTLGVGVALTRLSSHAWLRLPATAYVEVLRGTPMLVQIFIMYFAFFPMLAEHVPGLEGLARANAIYAGMLALGVNSSAYLGEIFRGGIQSVDIGQYEAGRSLGMTPYRIMRHIVLPQALVNALPAVGNEFVTLIKDSSLVSAIAVADLTYRAQQAGGRSYEFFSMYLAIAIIYFCLTFAASRGLAVFEKKLRVYDPR
ncbi:amino acid ABC transporter permease [Geminisphaera colitermitum]|uniref:amino acid ABC transporter permease n=1 Tax=Geminisphaera colitermitum TaxID=1148786 RepID=UPI000158C53A|nr:amino acid ABC transporter permease [Geminisphaera colitermitum]